jgi:hypothetical protein
MTTHRPLSAWVARVLPGQEELAAVNDGDDRVDARHLDLFAQGWLRLQVDWDGRSVLALRRETDGLTVLELDDNGMPIGASPHAVSEIEHLEDSWPLVRSELLSLAGEELPLRYWLLERLDAEGDPPDEAFTILPWELLDRAVEAVGAALEPGGALGELVEMRHWLTPAIRGLTGPLEQLDHGLRTGSPAIAQLGADTLLANLRDLPLSRVPLESQRRLSELMARIGRTNPRHRDLAEIVRARLADGASAVPDDPSSMMLAFVVPTSYLGAGDDEPQFDRARLNFSSELEGILGPDVRGRLSRSGAELTLTLIRVGPDQPPLTVGTDESDDVPVLLEPDENTLRARIPWPHTRLPERLVFRVVSR